jgi:hypothetical protein
VALASRRGSAIVFTDALLNLLDADEAAAICAHELAHIEYYNARRLRRLSAGTLGFVGIAVTLPIAARLIGLSSPVVPLIAWAGLLLSGAVWLARHRQKNETSSDVRAALVTGDPEALIRALTKLYAAGRMPRRLQRELERQATHPSLARRIRDIRLAAGRDAFTRPPDTTIVTPDGHTRVTFGPDRLHWHEGEAATHSLSYSHLSELRVHAWSAGRTSLVAVERAGRRWEVPLGAADISAVQAALDAVDQQLGDPAARSPWSAAARGVAGVAAMFALWAGQLSAGLVAALAMARPTRRLRAAAGTASVAAGFLSLRASLESGDALVGGRALMISFAILTIAAGVGLLILVVARPEDPPMPGRDRTTQVVAALGAFAALFVGVLVAQSRDVVAFHIWSRSLSIAAILPLALAAALAVWDRRPVRYLSVPVGSVGALVLAASFPAFLDAFGRDPMLVRADALRWKMLPPAPFSEFPLNFAAAELRLSPKGRQIAVVAATEHEDGPVIFHLGPAGGALKPLTASDLVFIDDDHVLILEPRGSGYDLRHANAATPDETLWVQHVDGLLTAELSVGPDDRTWRVVGSDSSGRLVHVEGVIGADTSTHGRWTSNSTRGAMVAVTSTGTSAVVVETRYGSGPPLGLWQLAAFMPTSMTESHIWAVGPNGDTSLGVSRLDVRCVTEQRGPQRLACIAFDGSRSRLVSIDPRTRELTPIAHVDGRLYSYARLAHGWLSGWQGQGPVAIRLDSREGFRVASSPNQAVSHLAAAGGVIGALSYGNGVSSVRLYALD